MANFEEKILRDIALEIARKNGFSENVTLNIIGSDESLNGFMSEIVPIDIEEKNTPKKLFLIAKLSVKDEKVRQVTSFKCTYENETHAYENFIPALKALQKKWKIPNPFDSVAEFYDASTTEMAEYLILENLRKSGFEMLHLKELLKHEHVKEIFERYGKFHALSFAFKTLDPQNFNTLAKKLNNGWNEIFMVYKIGNLMHNMIKECQDALKEKNIEFNLLNKYVDNFSEVSNSMINHGEEKYACFIHGDCWSNNVMFKFKTENGVKKVQEIKFLDWQFCNIGPPVHDLAYSLYSGASAEVLDNLDLYLKIYHETLATYLGYFNLDAKDIYPFEELKRQWKKYIDFGAILGSGIWKMRSMEENVTRDQLTDASGGETYLDGIAKASCDKNYLSEHIQILFKHIEKIVDNDI